MWTDSDQVHNV